MKNTVTTTREAVEGKYAFARRILFVLVLLSVINIVLVFVDSSEMLFFSASVPYIIALFGFYSGFTSITVVATVFAAVILLLYFLCWIFSKKHFESMIVAFVMYVIDTLLLTCLYCYIAFNLTAILDVLIHVFIVCLLVVGVINGKKLKKMPEDVPCSNADENDSEYDNIDSSPIRRAQEVKCRVLLEDDVLGRNVCYRRVKRVNELVIDGYVYAEIEMLLETPHELKAVICGHTVTAGLTPNNISYISLDGNVVKKKLRLF